MLCFDELSLSWSHAMWRPRFDTDRKVNTYKQKQSSEDRTRIRKTQPYNIIFIINHITLIKYNYYIIVIIIIVIVIVANKERISTT